MNTILAEIWISGFMTAKDNLKQAVIIISSSVK